MKFEFVYDPRIELNSPIIKIPVEEWTTEDLHQFYEEAQDVTAKIPAKILEFDKIYMQKYEELQYRPEDLFDIMEELNELSGKICELNVLYLRLEGKFLYSGGQE
ncbi:MAG TPA: hypothetical protein VJ824_17390 [Bacillota bacterium]|nr:hypothetical protein [Bacillota bacterium]